MADTEAKVLAMVERALKKAPDLSSRELYERAAKVHEIVGKLSVRQFHARYVLPVKRKLAPAKAKRQSKKGRGRGPGRSTATKAQKATSPPISEMIQEQIEAMRADLNKAAAEAAERALKSGNLADIDKVGRALRKATRELARV